MAAGCSNNCQSLARRFVIAIVPVWLRSVGFCLLPAYFVGGWWENLWTRYETLQYLRAGRLLQNSWAYTYNIRAQQALQYSCCSDVNFLAFCWCCDRGRPSGGIFQSSFLKAVLQDNECMLFWILQYDLTLSHAPVFKYHLCIHRALMVTLRFFHWITWEKLRCIWILIGQSYYENTKHL